MTIMSEDIKYLANYTPNKLYINPASAGAYATIVGENEEVIAEIDVTDRCKLAVSAFFVRNKANFDTFKLTKLKWHKRYGWQADSQLQLNRFQLAQMKEFLSIIASLNLTDTQSVRLSLDSIDIGALGALLSSSKGTELVRQLAEIPELRRDVYAVAAKKKALSEFEERMGTNLPESDWQAFFETNQWIFGHGLNYISLNKVTETLTARTTGNEFDRSGKTADALMRTRAEVSQFVLVEIKKDATDLLRKTDYRPGCWDVSDEVSNAVTQVQKTTFEFIRNRFHVILKNRGGVDTNETAYAVEPRSFLIVGNAAELEGNDDKIACFELYRRNVRAPEILTFDELLYRARFIVENISYHGG